MSLMTPHERQQVLRTYFPRRRDRRELIERFVVLLAISVVIATLGLWLDSAAVVIAAMLVAPLLVPIMALSIAVVMGWLRAQLLILVLLVISGAFACVISYLVIAALSPPQHIAPTGEILARTEPTFEDLLVAACVGFVAAFAHLRREGAGAVQGAAIAVALVPPLAATSILIYEDQLSEAGNALLLFVTNVATVVLVASITLLVMGFRAGRQRARALGLTIGSTFAVFLVVVIIALPLLERTINIIVELREEILVEDALRRYIEDTNVLIRRIEIDGDVLSLDVRSVLSLGEFVNPQEWIPQGSQAVDQQLSNWQRLVSDAIGRPVTLHVTWDVSAYQEVRSLKWPPE